MREGALPANLAGKIICGRCKTIVPDGAHGIEDCMRRMQDRLDHLDRALETVGAPVAFHWLIVSPQFDEEGLIHWLREGITLCGFGPFTGEMPNAHRWSDKPEDLTCYLCIVEAHAAGHRAQGSPER